MQVLNPLGSFLFSFFNWLLFVFSCSFLGHCLRKRREFQKDFRKIGYAHKGSRTTSRTYREGRGVVGLISPPLVLSKTFFKGGVFVLNLTFSVS